MSGEAPQVEKKQEEDKKKAADRAAVRRVALAALRHAYNAYLILL